MIYLDRRIVSAWNLHDTGVVPRSNVLETHRRWRRHVAGGRRRGAVRGRGGTAGRHILPSGARDLGVGARSAARQVPVHSTLGRWLGGSTSVNVARSALVPLLVTVGAPAIRRVLVAVDQSGAAPPTLAAAERYATLFGAKLRALSVIEPLPVLLDIPQPDKPDYHRLLEEKVEHDIWPLIRAPGVETVLRYGAALTAIGREVGEWQADLLVVGSHGKGSVTRMLVGSVTETLINHLPTSLLVVPAGAAAVGPEARDFSALIQEET